MVVAMWHKATNLSLMSLIKQCCTGFGGNVSHFSEQSKISGYSHASLAYVTSIDYTVQLQTTVLISDQTTPHLPHCFGACIIERAAAGTDEIAADCREAIAAVRSGRWSKHI